MTRPFFRGEPLPDHAPITTKLGAVSVPFKDTEIGKFVKIGPLDSQHVACLVGDTIDGYVSGVLNATSAGFSVGGVQRQDAKFATADGSQAAGTGVLALGDYVVAGTPVAQGTAVANTGYARVRKATIQPGTTVPADFAGVAAQFAMLPFLWRVVSLGSAGTGAVGTSVVIERIAAPV